MKWHMVGRLFGCMAMLACLAPAAHADDKRSGSASDVETVEMFQAIDNGDIEVKFIPMNSERGTVIITNKTKKKMRVELPAAFAGVPLAQFGGGGGFGGNQGGGFGGGQGGFGGQGGGNQGVGGGFGGQGGGGGFGGGGGGFGGNQGGGGGFFNVMPEKVQRIKVQGVCLDHGLEDPDPQIPYELKPIASYTEKPGVADLCHMLGSGQLNQRSAQAAAWHLNNGMSWEELANKRIEHLIGDDTPYFSRQELQIAYKAAEAAKERHAAREKASKKMPTESLSFSAE
ncbi:hypothetical protein [Bremerella sp.]|uniref:hypothetical protein n=1 Tax=Bremerella sp. TaxID=2795602 RepID=UPI00391B41AA